MSDILIKNANIVNEARIIEADIRIRDGRIAQIAADIPAGSKEQVIDANGQYLIPGMIDGQVHFREPGNQKKGTIATESRAAVSGGITSFMEMPNTTPPVLTRQALADKYTIAAQSSAANYAFYMGTSNDNLEEIQRLQPGEACGVKIFMGASTGNMLVDDPEILNRVFAESPILIATHCEDTPTIMHNEKVMHDKYGEDVPVSMHPWIRSEEACFISSSLAVELARRHDSRLHVLHLTTEKELAHFSAGEVAGKHITAEACVHHLWFTEEDYASRGTLIKCNPAIKTQRDRDSLRQALNDNVLDVIATDHAPHTREEKRGRYFETPAGLPLVQHALPSMLELVAQGVFTLEKLVHKTSHAVAECYGVKERGYIREGYWADLALIDMAPGEPVSDDNILYQCGWSPYSGVRFRGRICKTWVNGELVWDGKKLISDAVGKRLAFHQG